MDREIDNRIMLEGLKTCLWQGNAFGTVKRSRRFLRFRGNLESQEASPAAFPAELAHFLKTEIKHTHSYSVGMQVLPLSELLAPLEELTPLLKAVFYERRYESFSEHDLHTLSHMGDFLDRALGVLREEAKFYPAAAKDGDAKNKFLEMARNVMTYKETLHQALQTVRNQDPGIGPEEDHGLAI